MGMDMRTALDVRDRFSDGAAVFDNRFLFGDVAESDFVTEGNVVEQFNCSSRLPFEGQRADGGTFFQILNGDTDIVVGFM
jgi:hypothetical protein